MNRAALLVVFSGALTAAAIVMLRPIEATMPVYSQLAERLETGPVATSFEPLGYSFLIASMPGSTIASKAKTLHFLCYVVLAVLTAWCFGLQRTHPFVGAAATIAILFNPYVLINLYRLNDNNVNVPAVAALFIALRGAALAAAGSQLPMLLGASALVGGVTLVRPNAVTLLVVTGIAAVKGTVETFHARTTGIWFACVTAAALAYLAGSLMMSGRPLFWPTNGPYNLFAGNNPAAMASLTTEYNAEPSLPDGLRWCGVDQPLRDVAAATYTACTLRFWREQPVDALRLGGMKLYTMLFRPNLRLADSSAKVALQLATMVLPLAWWSAFLWTIVRKREVLDPIALAFVILYAAPFVVTNADPRFRLPLDGVYALSLASPAVVERLRGEGRVGRA